MKKTALFSTFLFGIALLAGCAQTLPQNSSSPSGQVAPAPSQKKSDETAALPTYSNIKWGFQIQYPNGYEAKIDHEDSAGFGLSIKRVNGNEETENNNDLCPNCVLKLAVLPHFIGEMGKGIFKNPEEWLNYQKKIGQNYSQTTVANIYTAYRSEEQGRKNYFIFHQKVEKGVTLYDRYDISIEENDKIGEAILSSFKLITPLSADNSAPLTVNVLAKDDYAVREDNMPNGPSYPQIVTLKNEGVFADQIAAYGGAGKIWIGPKGWTGEAETGADGSFRVDLYPARGSAKSGPHITYAEIPGCTGCMLSAAAIYFPNAAKEFQKNFDPGPIKIPQGLKVTTLSPTLVTSTFPDANGLSIHGVVFYQGQAEGVDPDYLEAAFVLPTNEKNLSKFLEQTFIERENLK